MEQPSGCEVEERTIRQSLTMGWVYVLRCADGSYYTGSTTDLERRVCEHQTGAEPSAYTYRRRPVELVWCQQCATIREAYQFEQQIKGWTRAKKEALIRGDWDAIHHIVKEERRSREHLKRSHN